MYSLASWCIIVIHLGRIICVVAISPFIMPAPTPRWFSYLRRFLPPPSLFLEFSYFIDPIAVAAVLKTAGASPRLVMHITGESLLNDGSSVVFFTIAMSVWFDSINLRSGNEQEEHITDNYMNMFIFFIRMSMGGMIVGGLFGAALNFLLGELDTRMEKKHDILQPVCALSVAYICYWFCDEKLSMSGIIAIVTCGLVVNRFGKGLINDAELM